MKSAVRFFVVPNYIHSLVECTLQSLTTATIPCYSCSVTTRHFYSSLMCWLANKFDKTVSWGPVPSGVGDSGSLYYSYLISHPYQLAKIAGGRGGKRFTIAATTVSTVGDKKL